MKRISIPAFLLALCLLAAGCGKNDPGAEGKTSAAAASTAAASSGSTAAGTDASAASPAGNAESSSRILVVYFSRTGEQYTVGMIDHGNTAIVAEMIAEKTGADLFEVLPAEDRYPMTYKELTDAAKREQNEKARPAYAGTVPDLSAYDTVFIGAPVWWGDWPMIMYTFFEENADALAEKVLVPFSTHEGSGLSGFDKKLSSAVPGSTVLKGLAVRGNDCQNRQDDVRKNVDSWIGALGF